MAREWANLRTDIWGDSDWRNQSVGAQWLYLYLLSSPSLTYVGVADWRPARISAVVVGVSAADVRRFAAELQEGRFIFTDTEYEEVLVRSFLKHDGLLSNPNMWRSVGNDFAEVASKELRGRIAAEAHKLRERSPDGMETKKGGRVNPWGSKYLQTILDTPSQTPSGTPSREVVETPSPTTTTTATTTKDIPALNSAPKKGSRLPKDWKPSKDDVEAIENQCPGYDHQREHLNFVDYWIAQPGQKGVKLNWSSTWRSWMRRNYDRLPAHAKPTQARKVKVFGHK